MEKDKPVDKREEYEKLISERSQEHYVLRLYITGMTQRSTQAIARIKAVCEEHLKGRYSLEVVDIYRNPELAEGEQIIAAPTLIKAASVATGSPGGGFIQRKTGFGGP